MPLVDAAPIVRRWSSHWPQGAGPAVSSVLDILAGDVLEAEGSNRSSEPLVVGDRIDSKAFAAWTLGFPAGPPRGLAGFFYRGKSGLLTRIRGMRETTDARRGAFRTALATLGPPKWDALADMEVISLAMGHLGPSRQAAVLPVVEATLVASAAAVACSALLEGGKWRDRNATTIASLASDCATGYEPDFRELACLSSDAFEELAHRATVRGTRHNGPFSLPVTAWVTLLTSRVTQA